MSFKSTALIAAKRADSILLHYHGKKELVKVKPNKSFVAEADLEANEAIIKTIKKQFPEHSILSEETGFDGNKSDYKWVIDPLDGTHNFLHGLPIFGTSIALEHKNKLILGVLHFPILHFTAVAEKGKGAFLNGERINVSDKKIMEHSFLAFEFSYSNRKEKIGFLESLMHKTVDVRNFGSAIYNLLLVASGKCDAYIVMSTNEWDVAAGFLLVEEAGGKITDLMGKKYNLQEDKFVASNGKIHSKIIKHFLL